VRNAYALGAIWQTTDRHQRFAEESINLAYHGMRAKDSSFEIAIETNYDNDLYELNVVCRILVALL